MAETDILNDITRDSEYPSNSNNERLNPGVIRAHKKAGYSRQNRAVKGIQSRCKGTFKERQHC